MATPEQLDPTLAQLAQALDAALTASGLPPMTADFERPKQADHGDWATTMALRLAKPAKRAPRDIAQAIVDHLVLPTAVESVEMAGPGFLNFRFSHGYFESLVRRVLEEGSGYGRRSREDGEYINVEFVSANPTGPLHVGHARWAAAGDALSAVLEADGNRVDREYYVNDAGGQIAKLGESLVLARTGGEFGEDHYKGDYVEAAAEALVAKLGEQAFVGDVETVGAAIGPAAAEAVRGQIAESLHQLGVDFDVWFSERTLHEGGHIDAAVADLREAGHVYDEEGAIFLRTTTFGDDKDRVLIKADGAPTYFAADCAYLRDKRARGYDRVIFIWGADHHGYIGRIKAVAAAFGMNADNVEIRIGQMVNLLRDGEPFKMSKRAGTFVTLDEVRDEVGGDVMRYHFLRQSLDTTVNFDLAEVVKQSMDNPVHYVQYAHARISALLRMSQERGFVPAAVEEVDLGLLVHAAELELLAKMAQLPEVISIAADMRAAQRVARYAEDLAGSFHRFYSECKVLADDVPAELSQARYWLAVAAKQVLGNALDVLRVSAPERM